MIDTMGTRLDLNNKSLYDAVWHQVDKSLRARECEPIHKHSALEHYHFSKGMTEDGLLSIGFYHVRHNFFWDISLKPIRLLYPNDCTRLAKIEDYEKIAETFDNTIANLLDRKKEDLPDYMRFHNWQVQRIDYALNYKTPYKDAYLHLLHHGNIPPGFRQPSRYETSLYLTSSGANINFYDKYAQLQQKVLDGSKISPDQLETAKDILRLEVQCMTKEINRLREYFSLDNSYVRDFWNEHIAKYVLRNRISSVLGESDFLRMSDATSRLTGTTKKYLEFSRLIKLIAKSSNATEAKSAYCEMYGCPQNHYEKLIAMIRKQGINPITLSDDVDLPPDIRKLPNPCSVLFEQ